MPAPEDDGSARRRELLHKALDYVTRHGVSDLSLRPLAADIGSSPRVLLYLFGSKDGLIREILALARRVELEAMHTNDTDSHNPADELRRLWTWLSSGEHRPILRLFLESYVRSVDGAPPWDDFARSSVGEWLAILQPLVGRRKDGPAGGGRYDKDGPAGGGRYDKDDNPTLMLAVIRGLMLDLVATGDADRVGAAFARYLDLVSLERDRRTSGGTRSGRAPRPGSRRP
jgi:AcrR family transcriptional regulator